MLIYVEENLLFAPERCFEDESVIERTKKGCNDEAANEPLILPKSTLVDTPQLVAPQRCLEDESVSSQKDEEFDDETVNEPLVLPKSTLVHRPMRPPPGFSTPGKPLTLECIMEEQCPSTSSLPAESKNPSNVPNAATNTSFFQETSQVQPVPKLTPEKIIEMYNINLFIADALNALLHKCVNDPQHSLDNYEATIESLLKNTALKSVIESISTVDRNSINSTATDFLRNHIISQQSVPNGMTPNFGTSSTSAPKANGAYFVSTDQNLHQQASKNLSFNPFTNGCDLSSSHFNGTSAGLNIFEQETTPVSTGSGNLKTPECLGVLNEKFKKLNVVDNPIQTYFSPRANSYSNYFNGEQAETTHHFPEAPKMDMDIHNHTYQNNTISQTNNDYDSWSTRETNPFKRILASKRRTSESSDDGRTTVFSHFYDTAKPHQPAHNLGPFQPTLNSGINATIDQFQVPGGYEPSSKLDTNCNVYSSVPEINAHLPSPVGARNVWAQWDKKSDVSNGFGLGSSMYCNGHRQTSDDSSNIFHENINTGRQHININTGRVDVPHSYFNRTPSQEQPVTNGFDIKVPDSYGGLCSNSLINETHHRLRPNAAPWSPRTGFTSPLLIENTDEGYQTRPSTSNTLQNSPLLLQTVPNGESKRQTGTGDSNGVDKSQTSKIRSNIYENGTNTDYLIDYGLSNNTSDLNNKHAIKKVKIYNCGTNLFCRQVELRGCLVHIFHYRGEGWILTADFVDAFIEFTTPTYMISLFHILDLSIEYLETDKYNFSKVPELSSKIQRMTRDVSGTPYMKVHLIPLKTAVKVLTILNVVTKDEVQNAILKKEFTEGSISHQLWVVITAYSELLRALESGDCID